VQRYDLGPPPLATSGAPADAAGTAIIGRVLAPTWMDKTDIVYRLAFEDPAKVHAYAQSRWVAPPAELLEQHLRARLGFAPAAAALTPSSSLLRIDLDEFDQVFDGAQSSHVQLRGLATLIDVQRGSVRARWRFAIERAAVSADAPGAVAALGLASDELAVQLHDWLGQVPPAPSGN
jgi:cholesterol transport system auxiliary component